MRNLRQIFVAFLLLFVATTAMAQSQSDNIDGNTTTAVRADVNGDGVVNEADIAEIIAIMKNAGGIAEQPTYYWYVGQENPANLDDITKLEGIQQVTNYPSTYEYTNISGKRGYAYVILHNSKTLTAVEKVSQASVNFTTDTSIPNYTIYKSTAWMAINGVMVITIK